MKISGARLRGFLARPAAEVRVALVFGPDAGLVRERVQSLITALAGSPPDPFRLAELTPEEVKADPARLIDEALALSLAGGDRVVLVRDAGDGLVPAVRALLDDGAQAAALTVLEGGDLGKRSTLRRLCEEAERAVAIACYEDDGETLRQVIAATLAEAGVKAAPEALEYLTHSLGVDRAMTRSELAKLVTYMGEGGGVVSLADARAVIDDRHGASLSAVAFATAGGDVPALEALVEAGFREGLTAVAMLRAAGSHLQRLLAVRGAMVAGRPLRQAMAALKPPVLFFQQESFRRQVEGWDERRLAAALAALIDAEIACKTTGAPQRLIATHALLRLAGQARG